MKPCKHKYQPRYNKVWSTPHNDYVSSGHHGKIEGHDIFNSYLKSETYIHDICIKCGDVKK